MGNSKVYTCPLHPEVKSDKPGKCPKCGMDLVPQVEHEKHKERVIQEQEEILWTHFIIVLLGLFLLVSPFTFGYKNMSMIYSDIIRGMLLVFYGFLSINPFRLWAPWASCFTGIWLLFAPLILWGSAETAYLDDTNTGTFAIAISVNNPGMPGMSIMNMMMPKGADIPPCWSYNPQAWIQLWPIILT